MRLGSAAQILSSSFASALDAAPAPLLRPRGVADPGFDSGDSGDSLRELVREIEFSRAPGATCELLDVRGVIAGEGPRECDLAPPRGVKAPP